MLCPSRCMGSGSFSVIVGFPGSGGGWKWAFGGCAGWGEEGVGRGFGKEGSLRRSGISSNPELPDVVRELSL